MIWFLLALCVALYLLGVLGMGALAVSIRKHKGLEPSPERIVSFALLWPFKVFKNLF